MCLANHISPYLEESSPQTSPSGTNYPMVKGSMDGQAHPNVPVQPGSECVLRCGCSAECCQRLMGGGGHIVSAPTKQEGASRASVHMQGLCDLAWCTWCRLGGGQTQSSTWTFQQ